MKFAKPFLGVPDGEIYPVQYQPGDECPPELEDSARSLEVLEDSEAGAATAGSASRTVAQLRDELTTRGIAFEPNAKKADLQALLDSAK